MKILITGATGFLGNAATERLHRNGHEILATGRNLEMGIQLRRRGIRFLKAHLEDEATIVSACEGVDEVIHFGALAAPWGKYESFYRANVQGTRNVILGCQRQGVKRLIHISTPSIYFDYRHRLQINETDTLPSRQYTHYGATKLLAEKLVLSAGLNTVTLRPRAVFGPGDRNIMGRLLRVAQGGSFPLIGKGKAVVDLTYLDNFLDVLESCLTAAPSTFGRAYNVTNGESIPLKEMLDLLFSSLGMNVRYRPVPYSAAYFLASLSELLALRREEPKMTKYAVGVLGKSQTLDISSARRDLGYQPKVSLEEGFERFAQWWKAENS